MKWYRISVGDDYVHKELSDEQYNLVKEIVDEFIEGEIEEVEIKYVVIVQGYHCDPYPIKPYVHKLRKCFISEKDKHNWYSWCGRTIHLFETDKEATKFAEDKAKELRCGFNSNYGGNDGFYIMGL